MLVHGNPSSQQLIRQSFMMKLLLVLAVLVSAAAADAVTDELEKNGLPVGLLPSSISTYSIDKDGQFALSVKAPCYAKIDDQRISVGVWMEQLALAVFDSPIKCHSRAKTGFRIPDWTVPGGFMGPRKWLL